jgi:Domain of unknown function (DUF4386)
MTTPISDRGLIRLSGVLLLSGFLINAIATAFHPSGEEDDHEAVFREYAESGDWIAIHIAQFIGVIVAIAGLLVFYRALRARDEVPVLGLIAAGGAIATATAFALLQAQDGIALKYVVDAWVAAPPAEEEARFADAESLRWLEWGIQSYFRILFGLTIALFGSAVAITRLVPRWLGVVAVIGGALSIAAGVDVGYQGLASGLQDAVIPAFQLTILVFAVGVLVTGMRANSAR